MNPEPVDLRTMATRHDWWGNLDVPPGVIGLDGDLLIGERTISQADGEALDRCSSIAIERQHAANWLIGQRERYSEITTDT